MKKDTRKWKITYDPYESKHTIFQYRGNKLKLSAGRTDDITVLRDGKNFFILTTNEQLGYAGFEYVDSTDCVLIQDCFFQNIQEVFEEITGTKKDFFDYTEGYQADFLAQWIN
jgi:GT2 family glycosyltransferase